MTDYPWYGLADGDDLQQGDLLFACPFDRVDLPGGLLHELQRRHSEPVL